MKKQFSLAAILVAVTVFVAGCTTANQTEKSDAIRVGYFHNLTHAQAIVGLADGSFQRAVGDTITIEPIAFNAGPQVVEALFANQIDIAYIGPSPAVNGFIKSQGEALKIISGSMSNGASLVLQPELAKVFAEQGAQALVGKKLASPQQGNTQDVALRTYLQDNGILDQVEIVPVANADQLTLFSQGDIDGSWAPEPWASRLIQEASAVQAIDEATLWPNGEFTTTVVIVRTAFLEQQPELVKKWLEAHGEVTQWIIDNPAEAKTLVNAEIEKDTGKALDTTVLDTAWAQLRPTLDPLPEVIKQAADDAYALGFIKEGEPNLDGLFETSLLAPQ